MIIPILPEDIVLYLPQKRLISDDTVVQLQGIPSYHFWLDSIIIAWVECISWGEVLLHLHGSVLSAKSPSLR